MDIRRSAAAISQDGQSPYGATMVPGYRLITPIHKSVRSEVWRAEDSDRRHVAIKFKRGEADDSSVTCELAGLFLVRKLQHPNLLQLHQYGVCDDELFLVMELADGCLLGRMSQPPNRRSTLSVYELLSYARGAAEGIDYLHNNDLIHGFIGPDHILVFKDKAKIATFSLTHRSGEPLPVAVRTARISTATPPEFQKGWSSIHSDQYALAYTYACLRLGERGFPHPVGQPLPSLLGMPEEKVLRKALAREPSQRFGTCLELIAALESSVLDSDL